MCKISKCYILSENNLKETDEKDINILLDKEKIRYLRLLKFSG